MSRWVSRSIHARLLPILADAHIVDLQNLLLRLTFDNICGLAFGKDPETLARCLPDNAFASALDRATEATLNRFIFPECVWRCKKWLGLGMETTPARSVRHVDRYLSAVIKARNLELSASLPPPPRGRTSSRPRRTTTSSRASCARGPTPTRRCSTWRSTSSSPAATAPRWRSPGSFGWSPRTPPWSARIFVMKLQISNRIRIIMEFASQENIFQNRRRIIRFHEIMQFRMYCKIIVVIYYMCK
ncbi:uncharacterized protein LOC114711035 [Zea mays]|nr:uncharacterized protein LOC114711035 [Zea mays]|eukprot:NP_001310449.1 uncharacterized protein LOC103640569 isoform 2 [Zea mays]